MAGFFLTTYSPYYIEELAGIDLKVLSPLDILKNKERSAEDRILAYRTRSELWGQERTVIVTYNPRTARKKAYTFEKKLESIRETLLEYRRRYKEQRPHWRNSESIVDRYHRDCEKLHISSRYYNLEFSDTDDTPDMSFRKDVYQVTKAEKLFGRNEKDRISGKTILEEMSNLDSVWLWYAGKRKPERMIEAPMKTQSEVLKSFGWEIIDGGVLQECVH